MPLNLCIFNPSPHYWRSGHITTPWQPIYEQTKIPPEELILYDSSARSLPCQVDHIDPDDPSRDVLVFSLLEAVEPGTEDYSYPSAFVSISQRKPEPQAQGESRVEVGKHGIKLINSRMTVWFSLKSLLPGQDQQNWYAGSATSVVLDNEEILDIFRGEMHWLGHDPEKRCMQVDRIQILCPPWETKLYQEVSLRDSLYQLKSKSEGSVRASITIASEPFNYIYSDLNTGQESYLECQFYRVISLYAGANYLIEELFVKGKPTGRTTSKKVLNLSFAARYYAHMDMGLVPNIYQFANLPNWFAVGFSSSPGQGYGFASSVNKDPIAYPYLDPVFPNWLGEAKHKRFAWQLSPCKFAKCVHLMMHGEVGFFDSRTGHCWYELIHKPLKAEIYDIA